MVSVETQQRLFTQARDEEERQRLTVAFHAAPEDSEASLWQDIFEKVLFGLLHFGGAATIFFATVYLGTAMLPIRFMHSGWFFSLCVITFLAPLGLAGISYEWPGGCRRERWVKTKIHQYAFPLTLAFGLLLGWWL